MLWTQYPQSHVVNSMHGLYIYCIRTASFPGLHLYPVSAHTKQRGVSLGTKLVHLVQTHCLQHILQLDTRAIGIRRDCNQQSLLTVNIKWSPPPKDFYITWLFFDWFCKWGQTYMIRIWSTFLQYLSMFCVRCKVYILIVWKFHYEFINLMKITQQANG